MVKTQDKIKELLSKHGKMSQSQIEEGLETEYDINLSSDSVWRNLKALADKREVTVTTEQAPPRYPGCEDRRPWHNIYKLDKQKKL